jgi:hypothetical protein
MVEHGGDQAASTKTVVDKLSSTIANEYQFPSFDQPQEQPERRSAFGFSAWGAKLPIAFRALKVASTYLGHSKKVPLKLRDLNLLLAHLLPGMLLRQVERFPQHLKRVTFLEHFLSPQIGRLDHLGSHRFGKYVIC